MNALHFAHAWLESKGLFNKDSDFCGWLGRAVEDAWSYIHTNPDYHDNLPAARVFELLHALYEDFYTPGSPIWIAYWQSEEGQALLDAHGMSIEQVTGTYTAPMAEEERKG